MGYVTVDDYEDEPPDDEVSLKRTRDLERLLKHALDFLRGRCVLEKRDLVFMIESTIEGSEDYDDETKEFLTKHGFDC